MKQTTKKDLIAEIMQSHPSRHKQNFTFEDVTIEVQSNSGLLLEKLRAYYEPFMSEAFHADIVVTAHEIARPKLPLTYTAKEPDPGKTKIKEEFVDIEGGRVVRKVLTGMIFVFGGDDNLAMGPCINNYNQIINFINNRYIAWRLNQGCLLGHAAGVVHNGRGIGLAGFSGMGKSSLALILMNRGVSFLSNDRLLVEADGAKIKMHGVAKLPRINPGTALNNPMLETVMPPADREQFQDLDEDELWEVEHKYDVFIDDCYGPGRFVLQGPMDGLVILNWRRNSEPLQVNRVDPDKRRDLLPAFMKSPGLFYLADGERTVDLSQEAYAKLLSQGVLFEITGGVDFEAAADACMAFLNGT